MADLERSHAFYAGVLGLPLVLDQGTCRIYRACGQAYLGICRRPGARAAEGVIITLVSAEVDAWHRHLVATGATVVQAPCANEQYRIYHAFYRDPDGHLVEIQQFADRAWAGQGG